MKGFSIKKTLILVSILAIPGFLFFYLLPHFAKNRYKSLAIFGDRKVASTFHSVKGKQIPDTIYHQIPDFSLKNQNGALVNWSTYKDKLIVLSLFNDKALAQQSNDYIKRLYGNYLQKPLVKFVSLSLNDKADITKAAKNYDAKAGKWDFLVGDTAQTYALIRKGLLLDVLNDQHNNKIIFTDKILLIDQFHRIRGFYEADNKESTDKLEDEIKVLIAEYLRNLKDGR